MTQITFATTFYSALFNPNNNNFVSLIPAWAGSCKENMWENVRKDLLALEAVQRRFIKLMYEEKMRRLG